MKGGTLEDAEREVAGDVSRTVTSYGHDPKF